MANKIDNITNYFGDLQTAHVYAYYKNGEFYDFDTNEKVELEERNPNEPFDKNNPDGVLVKIIVPLSRTTDSDYARHKEQRDQCFLAAGNCVEFYLDLQEPFAKLKFVVRLDSDLSISKRGKKEWRLSGCDCTLVNCRNANTNEIFDLEEIKALSLNQMFLKASIKYRPNNASHNTNVFKSFYVASTGESLNQLRQRLG